MSVAAANLVIARRAHDDLARLALPGVDAVALRLRSGAGGAALGAKAVGAEAVGVGHVAGQVGLALFGKGLVIAGLGLKIARRAEGVQRKAGHQQPQHPSDHQHSGPRFPAAGPAPTRPP